MTRHSHGRNRRTTWSRLSGLLLAVFLLSLGSFALAAEPAVSAGPDIRVAQGQQEETSSSDEATSDDESAVETSAETDSSEVTEPRRDRDNPFGHTATLYRGRR